MNDFTEQGAADSPPRAPAQPEPFPTPARLLPPRPFFAPRPADFERLRSVHSNDGALGQPA